MSSSLFLSKKGFTLIELVIVIALVGLLGVAAISSYYSSVNTFTFLGKHKNFISSMRLIRDYSMTNRGNQNGVPPRYAFYVGPSSIWAFADDGADEQGPNDYVMVNFGDGTDAIIDPKTYIFEDIEIKAYDEDNRSMSLPVAVFYEIGSGEVVFTQRNNVINDSFITFEFRDQVEDQVKYTTIFKVSGLPEEYDELP